MTLTSLRLCLSLLCLPAFAAPSLQDVDRSPYALGQFHRSVSTQVKAAQLWFDRGLALCYAFNHEEAIACFEEAIKADPNCALAYWGIAYASGPNINNPAMDAAAVARALKNMEQAKALKAGTSAVEAALIDALAKRYSQPAPADRKPLNKAYAEAMRQVAQTHTEDADVAALFAEALMILRPWYHWTPQGEMMPETPEIIAVLERGLEKWPQHAALAHFYIHTMEASPQPEKALAAANRLREAMPGAGHLVHMPSHIDVLLGDYQAAILANQKGIAADKKFIELRGRQNFYTLYRIHNYHFIVYAAMFDGQSQLAEATARELVAEIPAEMLLQIPDFVEAFMPTPLHVMVRFGHWQKILAEPRPADDLFVSRTVWHYARALAYAATGKPDEAEGEKKAFDKALAAVPESRLLFNNPSRSILSVADAMIEGEIAYRRGHFDDAFKHLREAVARDDALNYDEPWGWMQPARHSLGALLLEQGKISEAEAVYRADLKRHPKNAWSLHGLAECLARNNQQTQAAQIREKLDQACARADVAIEASCYCRLTAQKSNLK